MELVQQVAPGGTEGKHWDFWLEESESKLLVVDVHKEWCGPCSVMQPTFRRIYLDLEMPDHRIAFLEADRSKVTVFAEAEEAEGEKMEVSCKPHFQLWKNKAMIAHIDGANAPDIAHLIAEHVPDVPEDI